MRCQASVPDQAWTTSSRWSASLFLARATPRPVKCLLCSRPRTSALDYGANYEQCDGLAGARVGGLEAAM